MFGFVHKWHRFLQEYCTSGSVISASSMLSTSRSTRLILVPFNMKARILCSGRDRIVTAAIFALTYKKRFYRPWMKYLYTASSAHGDFWISY